MIKNRTGVLALLVLMVAFTSWAATTWQIQTKLTNAGGKIKVGVKADQTTVGVTALNNYTTSARAIPVVVTPDAGSKIASVTRGGVVQIIADPTVANTFNFVKSDGLNQSLSATFVPTLLAVTGNAAAGGTISPSKVTLNYGQTATFTVTPLPGYIVSGITGGTASPALPSGAPVTVTVANVQANSTVSATFTLTAVNAGVNQNVQTNTVATLAGTVTGGTRTLWSQVGTTPAVVSITNPTSLTPTFTPPVDGTYVFKLDNYQGVAVIGSSTTQVYATSNLVAFMKNQCQRCHTGATETGVTLAFTGWSTSKHEVNSVSCITCHGTTMPNPNMSSSVCSTCHTNLSAHPVDIGGNPCASCHNPHSLAVSGGSSQAAPHSNDITTGMYPASYITSKITCTDCHVSGATNQTIRQQWAASGHAATTALPWIAYDFKTQTDGCVRCHTTTGFIAYSTAKVTAAWGVDSDKTKEVLACIGCHSDVAAGTVRTVTPNHPFADEADYANRNVGTSNICMSCHSGNNNGKSVAKLAVLNNITGNYVAPHYLTAAGTLHAKSGYEFPGRTYATYSSNSHRVIGMSNAKSTGTDGPCIACHMSAASQHSYKPVSTDANGVITAITTTVCANCHSTTLAAATLDAKRVAFTNALDVLKAQLQAKGYSYSDNYPYFNKNTWGSGQAGANVMGAAYNYKLLLAEPGAYAHNPVYTNQLIIDSIDAVYNSGTVTGDISAALSSLVSSNAISQQVADSLKASNSCSSCHGYPPASATHAFATTSPLNCSNCHIYTGSSASTHNNGTVDINMTCSSCHGNPPSTQTLHTTGAVKYTHNNQAINYTTCSACHETPATVDATATHRDGTVELKTNATACSSCHDYPPTTPEHATAVAGSAPNCANCHIYSGYNGSTHNNGALDMVAVLSCDACHGYPPAPKVTSIPTTFGTAGNWANARFEEYSGGGGAHLLAQHVSPNATPSEGWANCAVCHNGGDTATTPYHKMATPVSSHISNVRIDVDAKIRFSEGFTIYTGAKLQNPPALNVTGSCFNISCHMSSSPRWSMER